MARHTLAQALARRFNPNPHGDLVQRIVPRDRAGKCDITICHETVTRLIEYRGSVFGEYCPRHSAEMFPDMLRRLREELIESAQGDK